MQRPIVRPLVRSLVRSLIGSVVDMLIPTLKRWAYNFDGVDDVGVLAFRAIDPDGDIDIEFKTGSTVPVEPSFTMGVISQNVSGTSSAWEVVLRVANPSGNLQLIVGGLFGGSMGEPIQANTHYRVTLTGTSLKYYKNGVEVAGFIYSRGAVREPTAKTVLGGRTNNTIGTYTGRYHGELYDVKINGVLYPIADKDQTIQLPLPNGLGAELITQSVLENPAVKGSQWTYLGDGRWQYIGDGSLNELQFIATASQPELGYLEFELETINGQLSCTNGAGSSTNASVFNTPGLKRYFYTTAGPSAANKILFKRNFSGVGIVTSCIIKNISFKSMADVTNFTLTGSWTVIAGTATTNTATTVAVTGSPDSIASRALPNGLVAGQPVTFAVQGTVGAAFQIRDNFALKVNHTLVAGVNLITTTFTAGELADLRIQVERGNGNIGVVIDSVQSMVFTTNPLTLINTTPDRWEEIEGTIPSTRYAYDFDGVDDRAGTTVKLLDVASDNTFEFMSPKVLDSTLQCIISQNISSTVGSQEFQIYVNTSNQLVVVRGGTSTVITVAGTLKAKTRYGVTIISDVVEVFEGGLGGVLLISKPALLGSAREATARFMIGCRASGSLTTYANFFKGLQYDVKINGTVFSIGSKDSATQPSDPVGTTLTLTNTSTDRWKEILA